MNKEEIIERLKAGNKRFVNDQLEHKCLDSKRREVLTEGQEPFAIILSCADSRVVPEMAFDTGLGELFIVRIAGNIANTDSIASIEYAVAHCHSKVIVVLGHESCGAVTAAVQGGDNGYNLNHLLFQIQPAIAQTEDTSNINEVVKTNAKNVASDLLLRSEIISNSVKQGDVKVVSAYYNLGTGQIDFLD